MDVNARLMKLHARLASPFGEANRPSVLEPILVFLLLGLIGTLLELFLANPNASSRLKSREG